MQYTGGCLCGAIRLTADGPPYRVGLCHCNDCRRHHGALFLAAAIFPQEAVSVTGAPRSYAGRFFCGTCGSSVFSRTSDEVEVHLGALDCAEDLVPSYELWTIRRATWLPHFPTLQSYPRDRESTGRQEAAKD